MVSETRALVEVAEVAVVIAVAVVVVVVVVAAVVEGCALMHWLNK